MNINSERLRKRFNHLSEIGRTKNGGISRLALTEDDKIARDLFIGWMKEIGLQTRIDDFGNIFGRKEGINPHLPPIVMGSHLDSVPNGGKFDGVIGVLAGLEIIQAITENNISHDYPIEVAVFTNEEGARFPTPMLGSAGMTEAFSQDQVYEMKDDSGASYIEELQKIGYLGNKESRLKKVKFFAEVHIEQGPILEEKRKKIGIVKGIQGLSWHQVTFYGQSDHSASTPMLHRKDALGSAAKAIHSLSLWAKSEQINTLLTFGKMAIKPNVVNVIPNEASFSIDMRHFNHESLLSSVQYVKEVLNSVAKEDGVAIKIEDLSFQEPVHFSENLVGKLENLCETDWIAFQTMYSGAGHDSMYMSRLGNTIMVFVPSREGKSHCEEEYSEWEDILLSIDLLYRLTLEEINED